MEVCCAAGQPVQADYTPVGSLVRVEDLDVYLVGTGDKAIVAIYDIFGLEFPQVKQMADRLSQAGYIVAVPDVFRGKPWPMSRFPPKPEDNLRGWMQEAGDFEKVVSPAAAKVVSHLKAQGVTSFGALGFCWGAAMAVQLATSSPDTYRALGFLHPTLFGNEQGLVGPVQVPLISCSAQGDPLETIQAAMEGKACASACVYRRYDTMIHGFCGARGDFSKPEVVAAVTEVLQLLSEFYSKNL